MSRIGWRGAAAAIAAVVAAGAAIAVPLALSGADRTSTAAQRDRVASSLRERFELLSGRHTNQCGLQPESLDSLASNGRLQGSCCQPMVFGRYVEQVRGLRKYAAVREVPADPYDVPVALAKRLVAYQRTIVLSPAQQAIYDRAVKRSHEGGPCCCRCWRWQAFEGQAKFLIARRGYRAEQVATLWDLEDGCGGAGDHA